MLKITSNIYQLSGSWGNADILGGNVFLILEKQLTLVDAGFRGSARGILKAAKSLGYSPSDIRRIVITHHHPDHIGALSSLKNITNSEVMAHPSDIPHIDGRLSQLGITNPSWFRYLVLPWEFYYATKPVTINTSLNDGVELPFLGGIKIIHTPGHTPGSIVLFIPKQKVIIVGDLLTHGSTLKLPSRHFTVDTFQELNSIRKISNLDFNIICFGHGPPMLTGAHSQIEAFVENLLTKQESTVSHSGRLNANPKQY